MSKLSSKFTSIRISSEISHQACILMLRLIGTDFSFQDDLFLFLLFDAETKLIDYVAISAMSATSFNFFLCCDCGGSIIE